MADGAGDELGEAVHAVGGTAVEGGGVFDKPAFEIIDERFDSLLGAAVAHGFARHFELVFDL